MKMVMVYAFEYLDRITESWVRSPDLATEAAIAEMGARVLSDTGQPIDRRHVAWNGIVIPPDVRI
jgi:hypothetical protein